jgi:hypothetical protein
MSLSRKQPVSEAASTTAATAEAKGRRHLVWTTGRSKDNIMQNPVSMRFDELARSPEIFYERDEGRVLPSGIIRKMLTLTTR